MVEIRFDKRFKVSFSKIKDNLLRIKIKKQVKKISENPNVGKPMEYERRGTREVYIKPFRLSYIHIQNKNLVYILELYHKKRQ